MNRQPRTFLFECERLRAFCFGSRFCAECAPLISLCVNQAMGSLRWRCCECCSKWAYNPCALDISDHPRGCVLVCEDCFEKLGNVTNAQTSFRLLFRTSRVFSIPAVASNIGACLAQEWTVREIRKPLVFVTAQNWRP